jgi:hypothetical protein
LIFCFEELIFFIDDDFEIMINKKALPLRQGFLVFQGKSNYFTFAESSAPALNFATRLAAILIGLPVCGLRPLRAERLATVNVPKPMSATLSPFFKVLEVTFMKASKARDASALVIFASDAIASINSALFIFFVFSDLMIYE